MPIRYSPNSNTSISLNGSIKDPKNPRGTVGVTQNVGGGTSVSIGGTANQTGVTAGNIGVGQNISGVNVGAGVNSEGVGQIGIGTSQNLGGGTSVRAGFGADTKGNVGPSVGASQQVGSDLGISGGFSAVGPTGSVQIGHGEGSSTGAAVGGVAGGAIGSMFGCYVCGSVIGSALGSTVGSLTSGNDKAQMETTRRNGMVDLYKHDGLLGEDKTFTFPDGSKFDFSKENLNDSKRGVKNPDRLVKGKDGYKPSTLANYQIDYTNDMDYVAGMAGITFSRLGAGQIAKEVDQMGNAVGNSFLGKVGTGAELTQDNFNSTMQNARSMYAKKGIDSKEEMLGMANQMFSEGRINDSDYSVMQQTAGMVFDNNFKTANELMNGRDKGIEQAAKGGSPSTDAQARPGLGKDARPGSIPGIEADHPGRVQAGILSPEESALSVQPLVAGYAALARQRRGASNDTANTVAGVGTLAALANAYRQANTDSKGNYSGITGKDIVEGGRSIYDYFTDGGDPQLEDTSSGQIDAYPSEQDTLPDYTLDDTINSDTGASDTGASDQAPITGLDFGAY